MAGLPIKRKALAVSICLIVCLCVLLVPGRGDGELRRRMTCLNDLKALAIAMHSYATDHGTLPPHAIYAENGTPLLSWRVLLLPYLDEVELYKEFKLDQPWDSPHNIQLLKKVPKHYSPVGVKEAAGSYATFYQVFVGKGTAFDGRKGMKLTTDFPDGIEDTILIIEAGAPVPWSKPEDLSYLKDQPLPGLGGLQFKYTIQAALADGSCKTIKRETSEETLRAAITRNGGETLGPDW